jgi:hypothetical protein
MIDFRCGAKMKFYPRRSRAGLAAAANVSAMRFSRLGVAALPGGGGPAQGEPDQYLKVSKG